MSSRLSKSDVKLLWFAGAAGLLLVVAGSLMSVTHRREGSPVPSSYSGDPGGALAAYLLLSSLHIPTERITESIGSLDVTPEDSVLILAEPTRLAESRERRPIIDFVERGGRVLFCGPGLEAFLPDFRAEPHFTATAKFFDAQMPSPLTRGAEVILMQPRARWVPRGNAELQLYGEDAVVIAARLGRGQLLWWASATPLTNTSIAHRANLRLFLNSVTAADGRPLHVYWDEYFHGQRGSLWSYVAQTPIPWGLWQLVVVTCVLLVSFSRRSGPVVEPREVSRLSPMEFVDTMSDVYRRAGATQVAVQVPYRQLRLQLALMLGKSNETPDAELAVAASRLLAIPESEISLPLRSASLMDSGRDGGKIVTKDAIAVVRRLALLGNQIRSPQTLGAKEKNT